MTLFKLENSTIKKINLKNLLCIMQLRLGISVIDLADRFQNSKTTAADTFLDVLDIFYAKMSPLIKWSQRPKLQTSLPMCFINWVQNYSHH